LLLYWLGQFVVGCCASQAAALVTAQPLLPLSGPVPITLMYEERRQRSTKGQLRAEVRRECHITKTRGVYFMATVKALAAQ